MWVQERRQQAQLRAPYGMTERLQEQHMILEVPKLKPRSLKDNIPW